MTNIPLIEANEIAKGEYVGNGASCVVYKGVYNGNTVALKAIRREVLGAITKPFIDHEASLLAELQHQNIARLIGVVYELDTIVLEYVNNGSLRAAITKKIIDTSNSLHVIRGLVSGIAFMHSKGILHLDLKSENILLDNHLNVKITDLGLSRRFNDRLNNVFTKSAKFTEYWAPPEFHEDNFAHHCEEGVYKKYTSASDIWSVGMVMYEVVTGKLPWEDIPNWKTVLKQGQRPPLPATCDPDIKQLIEKTWKHKPEDRIDSSALNYEVNNIYQKVGVAHQLQLLREMIKEKDKIIEEKDAIIAELRKQIPQQTQAKPKGANIKAIQNLEGQIKEIEGALAAKNETISQLSKILIVFETFVKGQENLNRLLQEANAERDPRVQESMFQTINSMHRADLMRKCQEWERELEAIPKTVNIYTSKLKKENMDEIKKSITRLMTKGRQIAKEADDLKVQLKKLRTEQAVLNSQQWD